MTEQGLSAIRKAQADLERIAAETGPDHPADGFELSIIARRIAAQFEMAEQGIFE